MASERQKRRWNDFLVIVFFFYKNFFQFLLQMALNQGFLIFREILGDN